MIELNLKEHDAGGATLTLPKVTGVTDNAGWPGCITGDVDDNGGAQGLTTSELCRSLSASFLARNAVEVTDSTSEIWGDRTLVLKGANIQLGKGMTEGQRLTLVCAVGSGCNIIGENVRTATHIDNGKIRDVLWDGAAWVLADRQNTAIKVTATTGGDTLVLRDANGCAQFHNPIAAQDAATMDYVRRCINDKIKVTVAGNVATILIKTI